jgi:hypothetical protein
MEGTHKQGTHFSRMGEKHVKECIDRQTDSKEIKHQLIQSNKQTQQRAKETLTTTSNVDGNSVLRIVTLVLRRFGVLSFLLECGANHFASYPVEKAFGA